MHEDLEQLAARAWPLASPENRPRLIAILRTVFSVGGADRTRIDAAIAASLRALASKSS